MAKKLPLETLDLSERIELFFLSAADFIYQRMTLFISLAVGFIVVAVSIYGWSEFQEAQQVEQANALYETERAFEEFFEEEDFEQGVAVMQKFVDQFPDSVYAPALLVRIGDTYGISQQWEHAIRAYRQAKDSPKVSEHIKKMAFVSLVIAYVETQQFEKANQELATLEDQTWSDAKLRLQAAISLAQGNINDAKKKLEELTTNFPNSPLTSYVKVILEQ